MPPQEIDINPVTHITTDAIGPPGKRVFYIQAWQGDRVTSLIVEKLQIQTLAIGVEQFLVEIHKKFPHLSATSTNYDEDKMHIHPPVDPIFRVGEFGLGYDPDHDQMVLVAREFLPEDKDISEARIVRFWCTRSQIHSMTRWGIEVASRGREICPQCNDPIDPEGHFCPKKNGHKH
ncbi:MAG: DUF3090 domain-containing protein [Chloroflexota bacterium]